MPVFLNPMMLAGLGGALVPLVLHLLNRARFRTIDWGAMMFLEGSTPRDRRSSRVRQYLLLALRMLILATIAIAMARPIASDNLLALAPGGSANIVIVLDCSASMSIVESGRTRMDAARDVASRVLATLKPGDRVSLLTAGLPQSDEELVPTTDLRTAAARVAAANATGDRADMANALSRAADVIERYARGQDARVVVVSDRQAVNWRDVSSTFGSDLRARFGGTENPNRITIIPVGADLADNLAIESVRLVNPPAIKGESADVEVRVRSYGATAQPSVELTLLRPGGRVVGTKTISVPAGESATARFGVKYDEKGSHVLDATLQGVGMTADDSYDTAIDVVDPVRVLFVTGGATASIDPTSTVAPAIAREATFFTTAAAPYAATGKPGVDPIAVTVVAAQQFDSQALEKAQVVVLANVAQVSPAMAKALEQFVYEGGGALIAPGSLVDADQYNASLWRDGSGILPAKFEPAVPADGSRATTLLGVDLNHPAMAFLKGRPDPIPSATIGRYFPVVPRQTDTNVIATYASGRPFLIESKWGRGHVALMTTPLDADWSTLPLSNFYLPFVQSLVRYLASRDGTDRNVLAGTPITAVIEGVVEGSPTMRPPDGKRQTPSIQRIGSRTVIQFEDTQTPGIYRLQYKSAAGDQSIHFVARRSAEESDISPLSKSRWEDLLTTLGARRIDLADRPDAIAITGTRQGRELWGPVLAIAFGLLSLESLVSKRWSSGVSA